MKRVTIEVRDNAIVVFNDIGALSEVGANLPDLFRRHKNGEITINNINRPDIAEVYAAWQKQS